MIRRGEEVVELINVTTTELTIDKTKVDYLYVNDKMVEYNSIIEGAYRELMEDNTTRRCFVQFAMYSGPMNCTASIHIQVLEDDSVMVTSNHRSMDMKKKDTDFEIVRRVAIQILRDIKPESIKYFLIINNLHFYEQ